MSPKHLSAEDIYIIIIIDIFDPVVAVSLDESK
jgi:hypothetical protein